MVSWADAQRDSVPRLVSWLDAKPPWESSAGLSAGRRRWVYGGLQIAVTLLEFTIVILGGLVLLHFGNWPNSVFLAERPLGYVVAAGLKALALAIVVAGAQNVFDEMQPSTNPDLYEAPALLCAALLPATLVMFVPNSAAESNEPPSLPRLQLAPPWLPAALAELAATPSAPNAIWRSECRR